MRHGRSILGGLLTVGLALPATAGAATIRVEKSDFFEAGRAIYEASGSEANNVTFAFDDASQILTISDPGATISPGDHCQSIDAHTVRCDAPVVSFAGAPDFVRRFAYFDVSLGAGDDRLSGTGSRSVRMVANGGPGGDVLTGTVGDDQLDGGGGGHDELRGGDGADTLSDGDASGAGDSDVLDGGGESFDAVSYARRSAAVTIDLARGVGGEQGENDTLTRFDHAVGGSGPDRITGSEAGDDLEGGPGADAIDGRDGDDRIDAGDDADRVRGGPGDDSLDGGPGVDTPACGAGVDTVTSTAHGELLNRRCEVLTADVSGSQLPLPSQPLAVTRRAVIFATQCYSADGEDFETCRGTLKLREAGGRHRMLARGSFASGRNKARPGHTRLTALGRRLVARRGGVVADVSYRSRSKENPFTAVADWTLHLRRSA
jgi:Ca2+-binding RTX toxin-like protein